MENKNHKSDCRCTHCIMATIEKERKSTPVSISEKMKSQSIQPKDLMWHLEATERELAEYYNASANAMNRITAIQSTVRLLLAEHEEQRKD